MPTFSLASELMERENVSSLEFGGKDSLPLAPACIKSENVGCVESAKSDFPQLPLVEDLMGQVMSAKSDSPQLPLVQDAVREVSGLEDRSSLRGYRDGAYVDAHPERDVMEQVSGLKRKRDGNDTEAEPEKDDPLFVTKTRRRQRTVERVKKVNTIVKQVTKKKLAADLNPCDTHLPKDPEGKARGYQLEILREAEKRNTIVYLETGCGKTLIAVLRIRSLAHRLRMPEEKRIAIFLVPTVNLVRQQSCVIDCHTDLKFGEYVGHMGVDTWKAEKWLEEVATHEVLVMTPQILLDLLTHGIIKLDIVELLIFDECHHATKRHPYCKIMDRYKETPVDKRPKVFGMTASPVNRKGVKSSEDADKQLVALEQRLDAKVCGVKNRSELESFVPTPHTKGVHYEISAFPTEEYQAKLHEIANKFTREHMGNEMENSGEHFKDYDELGKKIEKSVGKLCNALVYCVADLGLFCALKAAEILSKDDGREAYMEPHLDIVAALKKAKDSFMKEALDVLRSVVPKDIPNELSEQVRAGLFTPKVKLLVEVLLTYRDVQDMRCIVFVDRVVAALVLANVITQLQCLSFLRCEHLAGTSSALDNISRKFQQAAIENFRSGQVNLLVATNVAEEGLDVQGCHSVIRFDICRSVRSYIQSRGRARRPGSDYIVFMKKDNEKEKEEFNKIVQSEIRMTEKALDRPEDQDISIVPPITEALESFRVESTGAVITTELSISFLYRFCSKLPGDKYYTPKPEFSVVNAPEALFVCNLRLPPNSPIHSLTGSARKTQLLAKQVVCLEAVKMLHSLGAVTDHLLPVIEDGKSDDSESMTLRTTKNRGEGTKKQKELHNTVVSSTMQGSWVTGNKGVTVHAYNLTFFSKSAEMSNYAGFAVLVESKLDDDVAQLEVELALRMGKMATAKFSPAGKLYLTYKQLKDAKEYQELLFNGMFSSLLTRSSKASGSLSTRKSLVVTPDEELWNPNKMYLLLPLVENQGGAVSEPVKYDDLQIDWKSIYDTAKASKQLKLFYSTGSTSTVTVEVDTSMDVDPVPCNSTVLPFEGVSTSDLDAASCEEPDFLQMSFGRQIRASEIVDKVVLTIHTGMIYVITKVLNKNAKDKFPKFKEGEGIEGNEPNISSYSDYFAQKHKHPLKHPEQPLLRAKQRHRPRNLLARNSVIAKPKKKSKVGAVDEEPSSVEIPPELCLILGMSSSVVRSAYLVPSVMHRLDAALTASELRKVISEEKPQCPNIPVMRIVEALTTLRCLEEFSLEGLELLGDSFLKYAQSTYLFLEFDNKHEGQLSARRCREICNAKLHSLATTRRLPEYIRDEVFDPGYWVPPGMHCPKMMLCRCNLANLWSSQMERMGEENCNVAQQSTKVVKIGKSCANGHRWLCSKTISDVVEALIGAYLVESDTTGAIDFMTWAGFQVEIDKSKVERARACLTVDPSVNVGADLRGLEAILDYSFINRGLLVEAITHASHQEVKGGFCYQRLEFLGDAVLDLLITRHLFFTHPGLTPGRLTDLRSAAVNNECFARVAVKHKFNKYLRHSSGFLLKQIEEFVDIYRNSMDVQENPLFGWDGVKGPKVLGDLVESIAGAILVDTGFKLETVWKVMKPLLSPIVTPATLPLHPVRELQELCHLKDFGMLLDVIQNEKIPKVTIMVNCGVEPKLFTTSSQQQKRTAQKDAAQQMLALLENQGIWHPCKVPSLGECYVKQPVSTIPDQDTVLRTQKRKLDEMDQEGTLDAVTEYFPKEPLDKKLRPSSNTKGEAISWIPSADACSEAISWIPSAEVCGEACHEKSMFSCSTSLLLTNDHMDFDSDVRAVSMPA